MFAIISLSLESDQCITVYIPSTYRHLELF